MLSPISQKYLKVQVWWKIKEKFYKQNFLWQWDNKVNYYLLFKYFLKNFLYLCSFEKNHNENSSPPNYLFIYALNSYLVKKLKKKLLQLLLKEEQNLIFMINDRICTCMLLKLWKCEKMIKSSQKNYHLWVHYFFVVPNFSS